MSNALNELMSACAQPVQSVFCSAPKLNVSVPTNPQCEHFPSIGRTSIALNIESPKRGTVVLATTSPNSSAQSPPFPDRNARSVQPNGSTDVKISGAGNGCARS